MKHNRGRQYYSFESGGEPDPMSSITNLSDVMMILAVGIMLALVLHWNVPITAGSQDTPESAGQTALEISEDDLEDTAELPEDMEKAGEVYYDAETGAYYIVYEGA